MTFSPYQGFFVSAAWRRYRAKLSVTPGPKTLPRIPPATQASREGAAEGGGRKGVLRILKEICIMHSPRCCVSAVTEVASMGILIPALGQETAQIMRFSWTLLIRWLSLSDVQRCLCTDVFWDPKRKSEVHLLESLCTPGKEFVLRGKSKSDVSLWLFKSSVYARLMWFSISSIKGERNAFSRANLRKGRVDCITCEKGGSVIGLVPTVGLLSELIFSHEQGRAVSPQHCRDQKMTCKGKQTFPYPTWMDTLLTARGPVAQRVLSLQQRFAALNLGSHLPLLPFSSPLFNHFSFHPHIPICFR